MQKNLNIIHPRVNVLNLFNPLLPLPLTFLFGCNPSKCGDMQDRLELGLNSFVEGIFLCQYVILGAIKVPPTFQEV